MKKRVLLSFLDSIFPKRNIIIFNSFPDVTDNSFALYRYIVTNREDISHKYKLVWTVSCNPRIMEEKLNALIKGYNHVVVSKKSFKGLLLFLRAKYLITTHGYFGGIGNVNGQTHINLWHGMPLKTIGKGMRQQSSTGFGIDADITVATSELFQELIAYSFQINKTQVKITGLPRNDMLFDKGFGLANLNISANFNKVIMWMPTYRKSVVGDIRNDGNSDGFGLKDVLFNDFERLDDLLKRKNYLLLIKPHPMDELSKMELPSSEHIVCVNDEILNKYNVPLYFLLADTDALITDYSSVFIDYLLTGNPIAFACNDLKEYENTRGFYFENIQEKMPGQFLENKSQFFDYLERMDEFNSVWMDKYFEVRNGFNPLVDGKACERFCNTIWGETI